MKQNSTKNMIIRHLKDIKAKIEQKSIHNMKLPFEGPFKNKYAGYNVWKFLQTRLGPKTDSSVMEADQKNDPCKVSSP